jgi:hypothetical protein
MFGGGTLDLLTVFVLAFLAETLTEYLAAPLFTSPPPDPPLQPRLIASDKAQEPGPLLPIVAGPLMLRYIAAAVGIALCIAYRVDLLAILGIDSAWPIAGQVVTGLIVGRGSNFVHDFASRWLTRTS